MRNGDEEKDVEEDKIGLVALAVLAEQEQQQRAQ